MTWQKKLIFPFALVAVTVILSILRLFVWVCGGSKIPPYSEIVGIQKNKIFIKEV